MVDPISMASGLIALVTFGLEASRSLYYALESLHSNQRYIRELKEEVKALDGVLSSLNTAVADETADLEPLKLPLLRCGNACREFEAIIVKPTARSAGSRPSMRDWARTKYMGDDIAGFKNMLAGYKSTITIALCDATLSTSKVTVSLLNEYKETIADTTCDLKEHLQGIEDKLEALSSRDDMVIKDDAADEQLLRDEKESAQHCLDVCSRVSAHIDQLRPVTLRTDSEHSATSTGLCDQNGDRTTARFLTASTFDGCKDTLANTISQLENRLRDIQTRLQRYSVRPLNGSERFEQEGLKEQSESIKQCLAICAQASDKAHRDRINVFEDVSVAEDSQQVIVSTIGDLICARNVVAGSRSRQLFGQVSDASVQQSLQDRNYVATENAATAKTVNTKEFEDRYGAGQNLSEWIR